jgi:hypothetical protein
MQSSSPRSRWVREVVITIPTWRLWVLITVAAVTSVLAAFHAIYPFLSVTKPVAANVLVVEGWLPDYALHHALDEYRKGGYELLVTSGGPLESGHHLSAYGDYATLAAATLRKMGMDPKSLVEAPAIKVERNRTYESAREVRAKLGSLSITIRGVNVVTEGPHARRTRLVYRRVFPPGTKVGVIATSSQEFDPDHWWRSSEGIKATFTEAIGWIYEFIFSSGR